MRLSGNHPVQAEALTKPGYAALDAPIQLQIRFALRHPTALDQLLADQQNPASARYHKWLKTGEFYRRFGPTDAEVEALEGWLKSRGFIVTRRAPGYLDFAGDVAQTQQAFAVTIALFGDGSLYANLSDPVVPQRFASVIGAILGMDNMVRAVPVTPPPAIPVQGTKTRLAASAGQIPQLAQSERESAEVTGGAPIGNVIIGGTEAFGPSDVRTFYDENVGLGQDGTGDCIAIVGISDFLDSAMTAFTNQFDLPAINYTREVHGANPGINNGEAEAELDLQWSHAAAPGAAIVYHLGSDLITDITGAVTDNSCGAISISYAFCGPSAALIENTMDPLFKQAAAQGQSVFVSAGDDGAAGLVLHNGSCVVGTAKSVNELSADPYVTSVGGTQFTPTYSSGNDAGHTTEEVWNDGTGSTGGGASQFFAKPTYQTGSGVPNDGARDVPDVALIASPESPGVFWGHDVGGTGKISCCIGGTSLSAPIWAGFSRVLAQLNGTRRLGNLNPLIYGLANTQYSTAGFHDVTIGNNNFNGVTGFTAGPGYDQATGWGTIDFNVFAGAVASHGTPTASSTPTATAVTTTPTPTPGFGPTPTPTPASQPTGGALSVPAAIRFPTAGVGLPALSRTIRVSNRSLISTLTLDIGTLAPPFTLTGAGHYSLPPDTSVPVTIVFSPDLVGVVNQQLPLNSSDPRHRNMKVAVSAVAEAGKLSAPAKVALVAKPGSAATKTVILRNSGKGMLAGTLAPFDSGSPLALVGAPTSFTLAPGAKIPLTIHFAPASAGTISANLAIQTTPPPGTTTIVVTGFAR